MDSIEFSSLCRELWGGYGWQSKAATELGVARETVRNYIYCKTTIRNDTADKLRKIHKENDSLKILALESLIDRARCNGYF